MMDGFKDPQLQHLLGKKRRNSMENAREQRRAIVSELIMKHYTYRAIRAEVMARLNLESYSLHTVRLDVEALLAEWRRERIDNTDLAVQLELEHIEEQMHEARLAWEKSKEDYEKTRGRQAGIPSQNGTSVGPGGQPGIVVVKVEQEKEAMRGIGDVRYLDMIHKLGQEKRKLLGLYAPEKKLVASDLSFANFLMQTGRKK